MKIYVQITQQNRELSRVCQLNLMDKVEYVRDAGHIEGGICVRNKHGVEVYVKPDEFRFINDSTAEGN